MRFEDIYTNNLVRGAGLIALGLYSLNPYWKKKYFKHKGGFWKNASHELEDDIIIVISSVGFLIVGIVLVFNFLYDFI